MQDGPNNLWKETTPDGRVAAYPLDTTGHVTTISWAQDAVGNTHTFGYSSGRLSTLQDAVGRVVSFGYDGNNLLQTIQDWAGRRTTFAYDTASVPSKPLLTTVTGPSGCQTVYGYNGTPLLTQVTDPNGYRSTYTYDNRNRVASRSVAGLGTTNYSYQQAGSPYNRATDPLGGVMTMTVGSHYELMGMADQAAWSRR